MALHRTFKDLSIFQVKQQNQKSHGNLDQYEKEQKIMT